MRFDPNSPFKVMHCEIPEDALAQFKQMLPLYGARDWAVRMSLEKFLDRVEGNGAIERWVHQDIQRMLLEEPPKKRDTINVRIPTALYARFDKIFPEWGATTWVIRRVFLGLVEFLQAENFDLEDLVERSVNKAVMFEEIGSVG